MFSVSNALQKSKTQLDVLPNDLMLECLSFLSPPVLLSIVAGVCQNWLKLMHTSRLWKPAFFNVNTRCTPIARTCHTAVVWNKKMYVLGGMLKSNTINDVQSELSILDFETMSWATFDYEIPALTEHSCIVWNNSMFVFGGYCDSNFSSCNFLFEMKFPADNKKQKPCYDFRRVITYGENVPIRSAHVALTHENKMYVSGGWACKSALTYDDFYALNLGTFVWEKLPSSPCAVRAHTGFIHEADLFIFGGCNNENQSINTLQRYNFASASWQIQSVTGDVPLGRSRCRGILYHNHFILVGGWNRQVYYDELYVLNCVSMCWSKVRTHSMPAVVQHSVVLFGDRLFSFAGFIRKNQSQLQLQQPTTVAPAAAVVAANSVQIEAEEDEVNEDMMQSEDESIEGDDDSDMDNEEQSDDDVVDDNVSDSSTDDQFDDNFNNNNNDDNNNNNYFNGNQILPANATPEQRLREDGEGEICNMLYCYHCFHAAN